MKYPGIEREQEKKGENIRIVLFEMITSGREKLIRIRTGNTSGRTNTFEFVI
jgi:hypothetical protein